MIEHFHLSQPAINKIFKQLMVCDVSTTVVSHHEAREERTTFSSEGVGLIVAGSGWGGECD